jgi:hypothetical protein
MMAFLEALEQLKVSEWVRESTSIFAYPTILLLHVMGMAVVAGVSSVICLRLLGAAPQTAIRPLQRLYPLMWWGFGVNALTGTALVMVSASTRLVDPTFYIKMVFIFAGVTVLQMMRGKVFRAMGPDELVPEGAKALAWIGLVCWVGAVTAGRLLAYV